MNQPSNIFAYTTRLDQERGLRCRRSPRRGFTLIEVLATLLLMAIALPAVMRGFSLSSIAAVEARRQSEAGSLAESKLNELVATGMWQNGTQSGGFDDFPDYQWNAQVSSWGQGQGVNGSNIVQELDVQISWNVLGKPRSITVSTLVYQSPYASDTGITGGLP